MGSVIIEPVSENYARLTRNSILTGESHTMLLPVSVSRLNQYFTSRTTNKNRKPIQKIFPELNADQRAFILNGISANEWDEAFMDRPE